MSLGFSAATWAATAAVGSVAVGAYSANKASNAASDANQKALDANAWQGQIAQDQWDEYKKTYQPLEQGMVAEAQNYDSPEAYDKAAGAAQADVSTQLGLAQDRLSRTPGLDPSSAASQAANANLGLQGASMGAAAQNTARTNIQQQAWGRKMDALGLGKGLVTNASTGMAQAASTAAGLSNANYIKANQTATNTGAMVTGLANAGVKAWQAWNTPSAPGGMATNNTGDAAWTQMPAGSNGYADGLGGGV